MKVTINIPDNMYRQLAIAARVEKRTIGEVIIALLEEANDGSTEEVDY